MAAKARAGQTKVVHEVGGDFGERLRRAQERVVQGGVVEDAGESPAQMGESTGAPRLIEQAAAVVSEPVAEQPLPVVQEIAQEIAKPVRYI